MTKQDKLEEFKKEFSEEIGLIEVKVSDLKKNKIKPNILQAEVKLHKMFGDEIYVAKKQEEKIEGDKEIVKLSEDDIAFDSGVRKICDDLHDDNFDSGVNVILTNFASKEE